MQNLSCPLCHFEASFLREFEEREKEKLKLHRCTVCKCEFLHPQPSNQWLGEEYRGYYQKRLTKFDRPRQEFFKSVLIQSKYDFNGKRVLEIGSGEGDCVAAINSLWPTAKVTAVEANKECEFFFKSLNCDLVTKSLEAWLETEDKQSFDFILLFDLLEHLRNPNETLSKLVQNNLAPNGKIIATFPNASSALRKTLGRFWPQYKVEHLFYFSKESVAILGDGAALSTKNLAPLSKVLPVDYLLAVGSEFGPKELRKSSAFFRKLVPFSLKKMRFPIRLGEWLWIAERHGESISNIK